MSPGSPACFPSESCAGPGAGSQWRFLSGGWPALQPPAPGRPQLLPPAVNRPPQLAQPQAPADTCWAPRELPVSPLHSPPSQPETIPRTNLRCPHPHQRWSAPTSSAGSPAQREGMDVSAMPLTTCCAQNALGISSKAGADGQGAGGGDGPRDSISNELLGAAATGPGTTLGRTAL